MKTSALKILFILAALAAAAFALSRGDHGYLILIAAAVFVLAALVNLADEDSRILTLASGELLVIAVGATDLQAGVIVQCAVIGAVLPGRQAITEARDFGIFAVCCIAILSCAFLFDRSSQVLVPFLAVTAGVAGMTAIFVGVQEMRERRKYAGGNP